MIFLIVGQLYDNIKKLDFYVKPCRTEQLSRQGSDSIDIDMMMMKFLEWETFCVVIYALMNY